MTETLIQNDTLEIHPLPPGGIEGEAPVSDKTLLIQSLSRIAPLFEPEQEKAVKATCSRIAKENCIVYP